jgi:hypothetical protein
MIIVDPVLMRGMKIVSPRIGSEQTVEVQDHREGIGVQMGVN